MPLVNTQTASLAASGFSGLPIAKQLGLLIALATSIAIGVGVVLWSREPNYRPLYNHIAPRMANEVIDALQKEGIAYKLDKRSGSILVEGSKIHDARLKLAGLRLPRGTGFGLEFLNENNSFSNSQFLQVARYRHALESELARTISHFQNVKSARIHLATPQQSAFLRARQKSSASVFVDLYSGVRLAHSQIAAIVHLVASSIPNLSSHDVTVVDQNGLLLTDSNGSDQGVSVANRLFQYKSNVEKNYIKKIEDILTPLLGTGKVTARVTADINFTNHEQTRESFNPDQAALRSEQIIRENREARKEAQGVPGALSNQPSPSKASATNPTKQSQLKSTESLGENSRLQSTKNYELGKTISHTQYRAGQIKRLTVAVVVDNKMNIDQKTGKITRTPLTKGELAQITSIVKDAIGFNPQRGDNVNVINSAFAQPEKVESLPAPSFWSSSWFWDIVKQVLGALFVLFVLFAVLMPTLKRLAESSSQSNNNLSPNGMGADGQPSLQGGNSVALPKAYSTTEERIHAVQGMAQTNPKQVATVVKSWVDEG